MKLAQNSTSCFSLASSSRSPAVCRATFQTVPAPMPTEIG